MLNPFLPDSIYSILMTDRNQELTVNDVSNIEGICYLLYMKYNVQYNIVIVASE